MTLFSRIMIIIHLSLVFSFLVWACLKPPLQEYYDDQLLSQLYSSVEMEPREAKSISWGERFHTTVLLLVKGIPPYAQAWSLFSLATCLLFLFNISGAKQVVWLLPIITALYAWDNSRNGEEVSAPPDSHLFPTENELYSILEEPPSTSISAQYLQLKRAWVLFIESRWNGERNFTLARIQAYENGDRIAPVTYLRRKEPIIFLIMYVVWNAIFASLVCRKE
jgi:hypothetical protein